MGFKEDYLAWKEKQQEIEEEGKKIYNRVVERVQAFIDEFNIPASDLRFGDEPVQSASVPGGRVRKPARPKFRLPNGVEWTGKGLPKKEVKEFMKANNMTSIADLEPYRIKYDD